MTLNFPNGCRSYDERRNLVRFWGYDSALEIAFFLDVSVLFELSRHTKKTEAGYLEAFDSARDQIHEAARKAYARGRQDAYLLATGDF